MNLFAKQVSHTIFLILFPFQNILCIIVIVLIFKCSKDINVYRYYLLNNIICSYIAISWLYFTRPSVATPEACIVYQTLINLPEKFYILYRPATLFFIGTAELSVRFLLMFR